MRRTVCDILVCVFACASAFGATDARTAKAVVLADDPHTLRFVYDDRSYLGDTCYAVADAEALSPTDMDLPWRIASVREAITQIVVEPSFADYRPRQCSWWFYNFGKVTDFYGLENLDVSQAGDLRYMFSGLAALTELDISGFNTVNVTNARLMFATSPNLTTTCASETFVANRIFNSHRMFYQCGKLVGGMGSVYDSTRVDAQYARIDRVGEAGYFSEALPVKTASPDYNGTWNYDISDGVCHLTGWSPVRKGNTGPRRDTVDWAVEVRTNDLKVGNSRIGSPRGLRRTFHGSSTMKWVVVHEGFTDVGARTFADCPNLESVRIPSTVTNLGFEAFARSTRLKAIQFDGHAPVVGDAAFRDVPSSCVVYVHRGTTGWGSMPGSWHGLAIRCIEDLPPAAKAVFGLRSWDVVGDRAVFYYDRLPHAGEGAVYPVDLAGDYETPPWSAAISNLYSQLGMESSLVIDASFANCRPTSMRGWFRNMNASYVMGLRQIDTSQVKDMSHLFAGAGSRSSVLSPCALDLTGFDTASCTNMAHMFDGCGYRHLFVSDGFATDRVAESTGMFANCTALRGESGTAFDPANPSDKTYARVDYAELAGGEYAPGYFTSLLCPGWGEPRFRINSVKPRAAGAELVVDYTAWRGSSLSFEVILGDARRVVDPHAPCHCTASNETHQVVLDLAAAGFADGTYAHCAILPRFVPKLVDVLAGIPVVDITLVDEDNMAWYPRADENRWMPMPCFQCDGRGFQVENDVGCQPSPFCLEDPYFRTPYCVVPTCLGSRGWVTTAPWAIDGYTLSGDGRRSRVVTVTKVEAVPGAAGLLRVAYSLHGVQATHDYRMDLELTAGSVTKTVTVAEGFMTEGERTVEVTVPSGISSAAAVDSVVGVLTDKGANTTKPSDAAGTASGVTADVLVVDLSGGAHAAGYPVKGYAGVDLGRFNCDAYKKSKLVLRRIEPATLTIGDRVHGGSAYPLTSGLRLTRPYYVGLFELTQRQWELVMGTKPSFFSNSSYYAMRPVERVSYSMIRGSGIGLGWPGTAGVDAGSFMGVLRARTGIDFDLPTSVQWENAARAGTATDYGNGTNWQGNGVDADTAMNVVGRYRLNGGSGATASSSTSKGTAKVGSYAPNNWGLYDMHGNVGERCLDMFRRRNAARDDLPVCRDGEEDPAGLSPLELWMFEIGADEVYRIKMGGGFDANAQECSSCAFAYSYPSAPSNAGFRLAWTLPEQVSFTAGSSERSPSSAPRAAGYAAWTVQKGLTGADAAWDAQPSRWGGDWANGFIYTYGEGLATGALALLDVSFDANGEPVVTTAPVVEGHDDFTQQVIGAPTLDDWSSPVLLNRSGNEWRLPAGQSANFFRVRLSE